MKRPLVAVGNTNRDQRPAGLRAQFFAAQTDLWSRLVLPTGMKGSSIPVPGWNRDGRSFPRLFGWFRPNFLYLPQHFPKRRRLPALDIVPSSPPVAVALVPVALVPSPPVAAARRRAVVVRRAVVLRRRRRPAAPPSNRRSSSADWPRRRRPASSSASAVGCAPPPPLLRRRAPPLHRPRRRLASSLASPCPSPASRCCPRRRRLILHSLG